jgi:predicted transcriptional regulator
MTLPRLSNLEMRIMESLWTGGELSVREIQESFPAKKRPAYSTVLTMVRRLEAKKALRQVKKIGTAFIYQSAIPRDAARRRLIDDFLAVFGGETQPIMTHLIDAGKLTLEDFREAEKYAQDAAKKGRKT